MTASKNVPGPLFKICPPIPSSSDRGYFPTLSDMKVVLNFKNSVIVVDDPSSSPVPVCYIRFCANAFRKGMNPILPSPYELNS